MPTPSACKHVGDGGLTHAGRAAQWCSLHGRLTKLQVDLPRQPGPALLGFYPREMSICIHTEASPSVPTVALRAIAKNGKQLNVLQQVNGTADLKNKSSYLTSKNGFIQKQQRIAIWDKLWQKPQPCPRQRGRTVLYREKGEGWEGLF